jgi:hypothetical protein
MILVCQGAGCGVFGDHLKRGEGVVFCGCPWLPVTVEPVCCLRFEVTEVDLPKLRSPPDKSGITRLCRQNGKK